ncbi:MAG: DUF6868 family protein [Dokdonella sp.]|jgi:hypothetical protein|uniref:DUF6868 family protein n=1 Tax=Dokdonella sp. TaxID=2291710 RepID=UPI002CBB4B89|nr:hypothetical protein [Xanthomonadales bacterium]HQV73629.1 hypothetical protein [Dokdonella sp.]HQY54046.1 hypothetical protein [Dokdonella sp.]
MNVMAIQQFLLCSLAVNYAILLVWFFGFVFAHEAIRKLHSRWFRLSPEQFDHVHYSGMAAYKIGIILFNLAPLLALWLTGITG